MASKSSPRLPRLERARIAQATSEVGETAVTPRLAGLLVAVFVAIGAAPHVGQISLDPRFYLRAGDGSASATAPLPATVVDRVWAFNRGLLSRAQSIEDRLAEDSVLGRRVRPFVQAMLTGWLGAGTTQVEVGIDGWLFYRPDIDHVVGPGFLSSRVLARRAAERDTLSPGRQPDPRPALVGLHEQLDGLGVRLIVVPTPVKPSADPRRVGAGGFESEPVMNRSYRRFVRELDAAGVSVFDVSRTLSALRRAGAGPLYLATDTHWRPETMQRTAAHLAAFLEREVQLSEPTGGYRRRRREVTNQGDTARLLDLGPRQSDYPPETVSVDRIETAEGGAWAPDRSAEVLLLGDSFTNVYSLPSLGWGDSAGLAEQLSFALGRAVDRMSQNDAGALAPRRLLATEVARDPGRLARTRVVVYQFAARELSNGDWRPIGLDMDAALAADGALWSPHIDSTATVEATVAALGPIPRPGSVPYRDHIVALHITGIDVLAGPVADPGRGAVVYVRSMIDNALTAAAGYRPGDRVRLVLESWANVEQELDGISRGELDDPGLLVAVPWWGVQADVAPQSGIHGADPRRELQGESAAGSVPDGLDTAILRVAGGTPLGHASLAHWELPVYWEQPGKVGSVGRDMVTRSGLETHLAVRFDPSRALPRDLGRR